MWISKNWGKLLAAVAISLAGIYAVGVWHYGELGGKPIYAALQGIEVVRRSTPLTDIALMTNDKEIGSVIGVPTDDPVFPNAWIAASTTKSDGSPYIAISPKAHLKVTCERVRAFFADSSTTPTTSSARQYIERQCTDSPDHQK